ncbi:MAG TPA: TetR/AcrR family transcriptional regulator [Acidobacteriota bacterium]|jgi:AcrR family transcriptional regulator|nr:TetR/AcrR family transcriptional regulator [Acidobacteriota bacterium]
MAATPTTRLASDRYDARLNEILLSSAQIFAEKGFHNASMRDIARATRTSLAGLYYYFQTKEELLYLISCFAFDQVTELLAQHLSEYSDPREKLRFFVFNHLHFFIRHWNETKVLAHEADSLHGKYFDEIMDKKRRYVTRIERILTELQQHIPESRRKDARLSALCLLGMMNWIYTWYNPKKDANIHKLADVMASLFLDGFDSTKASSPASGPFQEQRL